MHDVSDDGDDTDGNTTDDPTTVLLGLDTDGDGIPNTTDLDDDNDGIWIKMRDAQSLFNGSSFEQYIGSNSSPANELTAFPDISKAPFSAVNGDGEIWQAKVTQEHILRQKKEINTLNFYKMTMDIMSLSGGMKKAIQMPSIKVEALPTVTTALWSFTCKPQYKLFD